MLPRMILTFVERAIQVPQYNESSLDINDALIVIDSIGRAYLVNKHNLNFWLSKHVNSEFIVHTVMPETHDAEYSYNQMANVMAGPVLNVIFDYVPGTQRPYPKNSLDMNDVVIVIDSIGCAFLADKHHINTWLSKHNNLAISHDNFAVPIVDKVMHDGHDTGWPYGQMLHAGVASIHVVELVEPVFDLVVDFIPIPGAAPIYKYSKIACRFLEPAAHVIKAVAEIHHHAHEAGFMSDGHTNITTHTNQLQYFINRARNCIDIVRDILDEKININLPPSKTVQLQKLKGNLLVISTFLTEFNGHVDPISSAALLKNLVFSDLRLDKNLPFEMAVSNYLDQVEDALSNIARRYKLNIPAISALKYVKISRDNLKPLLKKQSLSPDDSNNISGKIVHVIGDGNCLFSSVIVGLNKARFVHNYDARSLREFVAERLSRAIDDEMIANSPALLSTDITDILNVLRTERNKCLHEGKLFPAGMQDNFFQTRKDYVNYVQTDGAWASLLEIRFIAHYLNIHITIMDQTRNLEKSEVYRPNELPAATIFLIHNINHYNAFIPSQQAAPSRFNAGSFFSKGSVEEVSGENFLKCSV